MKPLCALEIRSERPYVSLEASRSFPRLQDDKVSKKDSETNSKRDKPERMFARSFSPTSSLSSSSSSSSPSPPLTPHNLLPPPLLPIRQSFDRRVPSPLLLSFPSLLPNGFSGRGSSLGGAAHFLPLPAHGTAFSPIHYASVLLRQHQAALAYSYAVLSSQHQQQQHKLLQQQLAQQEQQQTRDDKPPYFRPHEAADVQSYHQLRGLIQSTRPDKNYFYPSDKQLDGGKILTKNSESSPIDHLPVDLRKTSAFSAGSSHNHNYHFHQQLKYLPQLHHRQQHQQHQQQQQQQQQQPEQQLELPTAKKATTSGKKLIGIRFLFPPFADHVTLYERAKIWVARHEHKYFVDWSADDLVRVDLELRPIQPISRQQYKIHMNRSEFCRNVKLKFCLETDSPWAKEFCEKLRKSPSEGGFTGLCQAKIAAADLWRTYSENYRSHQARQPNGSTTKNGSANKTLTAKKRTSVVENSSAKKCARIEIQGGEKSDEQQNDTPAVDQLRGYSKIRNNNHYYSFYRHYYNCNNNNSNNNNNSYYDNNGDAKLNDEDNNKAIFEDSSNEERLTSVRNNNNNPQQKQRRSDDDSDEFVDDGSRNVEKMFSNKFVNNGYSYSSTRRLPIWSPVEKVVKTKLPTFPVVETTPGNIFGLADIFKRTIAEGSPSDSLSAETSLCSPGSDSAKDCHQSQFLSGRDRGKNSARFEKAEMTPRTTERKIQDGCGAGKTADEMSRISNELLSAVCTNESDEFNRISVRNDGDDQSRKRNGGSFCSGRDRIISAKKASVKNVCLSEKNGERAGKEKEEKEEEDDDDDDNDDDDDEDEREEKVGDDNDFRLAKIAQRQSDLLGASLRRKAKESSHSSMKVKNQSIRKEDGKIESAESPIKEKGRKCERGQDEEDGHDDPKDGTPPSLAACQLYVGQLTQHYYNIQQQLQQHYFMMKQQREQHGGQQQQLMECGDKQLHFNSDRMLLENIPGEQLNAALNSVVNICSNDNNGDDDDSDGEVDVVDVVDFDEGDVRKNER